MPGAGISKAIETLAFLSDPGSDTNGVEMSRALYTDISENPDERYKIVKKFIRGSS